MELDSPSDVNPQRRAQIAWIVGVIVGICLTSTVLLAWQFRMEFWVAALTFALTLAGPYLALLMYPFGVVCIPLMVWNTWILVQSVRRPGSDAHSRSIQGAILWAVSGVFILVSVQ
jgi:hypothetical protein